MFEFRTFVYSKLSIQLSFFCLIRTGRFFCFTLNLIGCQHWLDGRNDTFIEQIIDLIPSTVHRESLMIHHKVQILNFKKNS